jgi:predicted nucleic acid-binding protein
MEGYEKVRKFVLDTSVAVKWFSERDEGDLDNALKLRTDILEGTVSVMALDLLFYLYRNFKVLL